MISEFKARQSTKIMELGDALVTAGFRTLDEQAKALKWPDLSLSRYAKIIRSEAQHLLPPRKVFVKTNTGDALVYGVLRSS